LRGVDLSGIDLSNESIHCVDFSGANLSNANLTLLLHQADRVAVTRI